MPAPRFQFSLKMLLIGVAVCAVALSAWFAQPPEIVSAQGTVHSLYREWSQSDGASTRLMCGYYLHPCMQLWTPRGTQTYRFRIVFVATHPAALAADYSGRFSCNPLGFTAGLRCHRARHGDDESFRFAEDLVFDLEAGTVSLGAQTVRYQPDSVYVVRVDGEWRGELLVDDGRFENLGVVDEEAGQLREHHASVLQTD